MRNVKFQRKPKDHGITYNNAIRSNKIRIVQSGDSDGMYQLDEALSIAQGQDVDLIEINRQPDQSICKLMKLDKFIYEHKQKEKEKKKHSHVTEMHEVRLSPDISDNDLSYRVKNAIEWLQDGDKVKCSIQFRGRQMAHTERGELVLLKFADAVKEHGLLEAMPRLEGRKMHTIIKPKK